MSASPWIRTGMALASLFQTILLSPVTDPGLRRIVTKVQQCVFWLPQLATLNE
ncbi:hypothetical protein KPL76_08035 [Subtercola sp. PAMC28395]|uniref:hypothetical protein n=1 Tax=Subtercola sp. PAMC28395 TaxID=2846775 RepID=UPI001C0D725A|nr:hypothetical protein [Subtercola sp. PAMC28395]QWT22759.1 hypothetical protein KPL76_08035 [Subtercola sp. PAMC28395]